MNSNKIILFDLGKVIFDFDHMIAAAKMSVHCSLTKEEIYNLFFDSDLTDKYERGQISSQDFFVGVKTMLKANIAFKEFVPIWNEIFWPMEGMYEILDTLKGQFRIYLVSNVNELHFDHLHNKFPEYFQFFDYLFLSYKLGLRKPDLSIYQLIIKDLNMSPSQIIYTDDRIELVEPAKEIGLDAFVFKSKEQFIGELRKRNINLNLVFDTFGPAKRSGPQCQC